MYYLLFTFSALLIYKKGTVIRQALIEKDRSKAKANILLLGLMLCVIGGLVWLIKSR